MPSARCSPVPLSPICAPVTSGRPSRKPVVDAAPPVHCATFSYTLQSSYGPGPKPLIEATIIFGFKLWIFSQGKPMRSSTPGPKFSTSTSQLLISAVRTSLPLGFLVSSVIERLLWFSMVKYRLSTLGMSCNCPRVMSPVPGRSTLITSAPNQASSCVQVGPDWTWVKSRIFTPSSALPSLPHGLLDTLGRSLPFAFLATSLRTDFFAALAFLEVLSLLFVFLSFFFLAMFFSGRLNVVDAAKTYFLRSLLCGL